MLFKTLYVASRTPVSCSSSFPCDTADSDPDCAPSVLTSISPLLLHLMRTLSSLLQNFAIFPHLVTQTFRPALPYSILNPPQDYLLKHKPAHITSY